MTGFRRAPVVMAAFARIHPLLPGNPGRTFENFRSVLEKAKISKIAFLRHGQTAPSKGVDFDRLLTKTGQAQAKEAGLVFGRKLKPFFSPVLVSPAPRTVETANILLSSSNEKGKLKPIDSLYDGTMQPKGSALFKKLGYAPLRDYLMNQNDNEREDAQLILGAYAHTAVHSIMDTADLAEPSIVSKSTLWMVAHAIYLPAAALGIASLVGCDNYDVILTSNTKEGEGYLVDLSSRTVDSLCLQ